MSDEICPNCQQSRSRHLKVEVPCVLDAPQTTFTNVVLLCPTAFFPPSGVR